MYEFSLTMAIVDFLPVLFFAVSAVILMKDLYPAMKKYCFALFAAGVINVFAAGFLKALWKLLYASGFCDFQALNTLFLPTQSLGFLMAGIALVIHLSGCKKAMMAVVPPVFKGTVLFLSMMIMGFGGMCVCLSILAVKTGRKWIVALFVLSFIASMGMGYAGRLDSSLAWVNWLEELINIVSQGSLLMGVIVLDRNLLGRLN